MDLRPPVDAPRRASLRVLGSGIVVGLSGCLSAGEEGDLVDGGDETPSPTPTPAVESRVDVPACPGKPDPVTRETVGEFAVRFEVALVTRRILRRHEFVTSVQFKDVDVVLENGPAVESTGRGFLTRFRVSVAYGHRRDPGDRETAVADLAAYTANYFVSEEAILRAESEDDETAGRGEEGEAVRCPPE